MDKDIIIDAEPQDNSENGVNGQIPEIVLASDILPTKIPLIPLTSRPAFPGIMLPMIYPPGNYANMIKETAKQGAKSAIGIIMTRTEEIPEEPEDIILQLHCMGTVVRVLNINETPDGHVQVLFQGIKRFEILQVQVVDKVIFANVTFPVTAPDDSDEIKALTVGIINTLRELVKLNPIFSEEIKMFLSRGSSLNEPGLLADFAVNMTTAPRDQLQKVLECLKLKIRLEKVLFMLRKEQDINELKEKINKQIEEKLSKQQRDFFLKEQLKAIKQELGLEKDEKTEEIEKLKKRIEKLDLSEEAAKVVDEEIGKLQLLSENSPEFAVCRNYLDWLCSLPWGITTKDKLDVSKARKVLDRDHYGLQDVKDRILEFIGVSKLRGSVEGSILCLIGPPGVGKTSLGRAIAEALGRKFFRFSLGGMRDEAEIKGHRRTYIGALPGKVVQALKSCESQNPIIMLDEIDKVGASFQGDPASALLEVLDPEQNSSFRDHYLDVAFDLSKVLFIATANVPDTIPAPLFDRMEIIKLSGYIMQEKVQIAKKHLIPKLLKQTGLKRSNISFTDTGITKIVDSYAREAGVRALEKAIKSCMRKVASRIVEGKQDKKFSVTVKSVEDLLGKPRFLDDPLRQNPKPGVVTGLAWTALGGSTLYIESLAIHTGKGGYKQTGQLGDVMIESANIAYSYVSSKVSTFKIGRKFFEENTLHLHVPAGATPKDGPSAGITMATSLVSLALDKKVNPKFAMTGELTLTGKVLPIGGVKEKILAARRAKIMNIILPADNRKDFDEIPEDVKEGITPHFVATYPEVYKLMFS